MKTKNIGLKNLLSGSFIIFIILAAISQAGAQSCVACVRLNQLVAGGRECR